jgi:hypothetical protein
MDDRFVIKLREGETAYIEAGTQYVTTFWDRSGKLLSIELFSEGVDLVERDDVRDDENGRTTG